EVGRFLAETFETVAHGCGDLLAGVDVRCRVEPEDLALSADPIRLGQALTNLIQNALQALGGKGRLELRARAAGDRVEIAVMDSGPGVPAELGARLFEPFFSTKSDGAGLGLALVQRIVELHDGEIRLAPGIGTGAAFVLRS